MRGRELVGLRKRNSFDIIELVREKCVDVKIMKGNLIWGSENGAGNDIKREEKVAKASL